MKMSKELYAELRSWVRLEMTPESYANTEFSDVRYRWDCMWKSVPSGFVNRLYFTHDLSDQCIDTALRRLMKELTVKQEVVSA